MPRLSLRSFVLLLLVLSLPLAGGCVKLKQVITLMPDGSGKVQYVVGFSKQAFDLEKTTADPLKQYSPEELDKRSEGISFFTKPVRYEDAGWQYIAFTGYFDDINKLKLAGPDNGGKPARFTYERNEDGGATLTMTGGVILGIAQDFEPFEPEDREQFGTMLEGFTLSEQFVLPGKVEPSDGVKLGEGSLAELSVDVKELVRDGGPLPKLREIEAVVLQMKRLSITPEQIAAFEAERAEAKEQSMDAEDEDEAE